MKKSNALLSVHSRVLLIITFIFYGIALFSQNILPQEKAKLIDHLAIVSSNWSIQNLDAVFFENEISFQNENQRIQMHFKLVEEILRKRATSHLTEKQITRRLHFLDLLKKYGERGIFPKNTFHKNRQPYFVDSFGTHCAIGHLVKESGETNLTKKIKSENNYRYVEELKKLYPELKIWAFQNGFTLEELAWIQPTYPTFNQQMYPIGNGGGTDGRINVMEVSPGGSILYMAGSFTEVDGVSANSIIAWDGNNWYSVGEGVDGEIFDLHWHQDRLHIAGNFKLHGEEEFTSIAYWKNGEWIPLQTGNTGNIYAMETYQQQLYIGGAFEKLDGNEMPFLAFYDENISTWSNAGKVIENGILVNVANVFSVDDTVRSFAVFEEILFVGGDFSWTSPNSNHPDVIPKDVNNLARWIGYIWLETIPCNLERINIMEVDENSLYIVGKIIPNTFFVGIYQNENIEDANVSFWYLHEDESPHVYGYFQQGGRTYFYGNIECGNSLYSGGLCQYKGVLNGRFNGTIRAAKVFKDNIYFAGNFTEAFGTSFNGLTYSAWNFQSVGANDPNFTTNKIQISNSGNELLVRYEDLEENATLNLYNLQGQILKTINLQKGDDDFSVSLSNWSAGAYVYQVANERRREAGKFLVF